MATRPAQHATQHARSLLSVIALASCASCADQTPANNHNAEESWATAFPGKADIYGQDSRRELNDPSVPEEVRELAQSVAMVVNTRSLVGLSGDDIILPQATMSAKFKREKGVPLCEHEPYAQQIAPGYCTAFLITPQLVATAGHCVNGHTRCEQMGFVFGYAKESPSEDPFTAPLEDYYRCEQIIGRLYNPFEEADALTSGEYWQDWAVLKLNRPVTDRKPVKLMEGAFLERGAPLTVLGHPSGLPMKVTEGDVVTSDKERYFNTTLDIYQGNSGSPTFDSESGEVHGIVIRGSGGNSFEIGPEIRVMANGDVQTLDTLCGYSKQCDAVGSERGCIGNHVLRIDPVRPFIDPDLKVVERHALVDDDDALGFRHSFSFDLAEEGEKAEVQFATLHLNAGARDSQKLRVALIHEDREHGVREVVMMNHPKDLPYGRWSATKFDFKGMSPQGEWVIEVIDEGGSNVLVEWAQVMVGYKTLSATAPLEEPIEEPAQSPGGEP